MSSASARRLACAVLVAVGTAPAFIWARFAGVEGGVTARSNSTHPPRTVAGRTYTVQPVEANLGPLRFMFPANLYSNQIGPTADGWVALTVMWPELEAAPPGDYPVRSVEDGYRQVSIELRYVGSARAADYLAKDLTGRVALPARWGLTPYAVDRGRVARSALEAAPDWYVVRDGNGRVRTFISCDPWEYTVDGVLMEGGRLVRGSGNRVAMCWHSMAGMEDSVTVEMSYARALLVDWKRLETTPRELMRRYEARR